MSNESLSALLDGECSGPELDRLLKEMDRNPELGERFSRWQLRRDLQEGTRVRLDSSAFTAGVMAALEEAPSSKVVDLAAWSGRLKSLPLKPLVGFAAAASMGAAAVLVVGPKAEIGAGPAATQASAPGFNPGAALDQVNLPGYRSNRGGLQSVSFGSQEYRLSLADAEYQKILQEYQNRSSALGDGSLRYARYGYTAPDYRMQATSAAAGQP